MSFYVCSLSLCFFLSHYYGTPRELHSFPTRRSSDLSAIADAAIFPWRPTAGSRGAASARWCPSSMPAPPSSPRLSSPDRKSTRLNSSHLGISYAVFCLKKKNKHQPSALSKRDKRVRT